MVNLFQQKVEGIKVTKKKLFANLPSLKLVRKIIVSIVWDWVKSKEIK
jgi:hypothetical protein